MPALFAGLEPIVLDHLHIANFRCFPSVDVPLRPLTVLIGPNDTGKSAFLDAISLITNVDRHPFVATDFPRFEKKERIEVSGSTKVGAAFKSSEEERTMDPRVGKLINPIRKFRLPVTGVAARSSGFDDQNQVLELGESGDNLPAMIDYLLRRDRKRLTMVVEAMSRLAPGLEDVNVSTPSRDTREIELVVEKGFTISAAHASVGVRMLLFIVVLVHHPSPPRIILLEEPENGVHPKRLGDIMKLLREITEGRHGSHPSQIILTTHSPYLLDQVDVERDQVLVFSREPDGSRAARPVDADRLKTFLDEFMLGEVWYNQNEEGLVAQPS